MSMDNGTQIWSFLTEGQRPVGFPLLCQPRIPLPPFSYGRLNISLLFSALSEPTTRAGLICLDNTAQPQQCMWSHTLNASILPWLNCVSNRLSVHLCCVFLMVVMWMQLAEELANRKSSLLSVESPCSAGQDKSGALVSADWPRMIQWNCLSFCWLVTNVLVQCPWSLLIGQEWYSGIVLVSVDWLQMSLHNVPGLCWLV